MSNSFTTDPVDPTAAVRPEFIRLPAPKQRDCVFGLTRPWYYRHGASGDIRLITLRKRGDARGCTLVDCDSVRAYIEGFSSQVALAGGDVTR